MICLSSQDAFSCHPQLLLALIRRAGSGTDSVFLNRNHANINCSPCFPDRIPAEICMTICTFNIFTSLPELLKSYFYSLWSRLDATGKSVWPAGYWRRDHWHIFLKGYVVTCAVKNPFLYVNTRLLYLVSALASLNNRFRSVTAYPTVGLECTLLSWKNEKCKKLVTVLRIIFSETFLITTQDVTRTKQIHVPRRTCFAQMMRHQTQLHLPNGVRCSTFEQRMSPGGWHSSMIFTCCDLCESRFL